MKRKQRELAQAKLTTKRTTTRDEPTTFFATPPAPPPRFENTNKNKKDNYDFKNLSDMTSVVAHKLWELLFKSVPSQPAIPAPPSTNGKT
jgi:hypothetical protein